MLQRLGLYPAPPGVPADVPGLELAGEVVAVGRGVQRFGAGDRVMAVVGGGGQAELAVMHERTALPVPDGLEGQRVLVVGSGQSAADISVDASRRALRALVDRDLVEPEELPEVRQVLSAAALTYVAGAVSVLATLLHLLVIYNRTDGD